MLDTTITFWYYPSMKLITVSRAATLIGITPDSIIAAIYRGALPAEKYGRDWLIEVESAKMYIDVHKGKPGRKKKTVEAQ